MIFTSNFKIAGHLPQAVAISRGVPRGWQGRVYKPLAPSWRLVKILDQTKFIRLYKAEVLDKLDARQVLQDLGADDFAMICWEPPGRVLPSVGGGCLAAKGVGCKGAGVEPETTRPPGVAAEKKGMMEQAVRRLKNKKYFPAGSDKLGVYLQNGRTRVYVDHIGIFIYRRPHSKAPWKRESGHPFSSIPWEHL